jgi:hypothetical protein
MTSEDLRAELEREPFVPLRLHLVSGKSVRVASSSAAFLLQNALMLIRGKKPGKATVGGYDIISLRTIERIESASPVSRSDSR